MQAFPDDLIIEKATQYYLRHGRIPTQREWPDETGISYSPIRRMGGIVKLGELVKQRLKIGPVTEEIPDSDLPVPELLDRLCKDFKRTDAHEQGKKWRKIYLPDNLPIAVGFMGDPHVDNPGTNWPLLKSHIELFRDVPGLYGVNLGDITDNWVGRLSRLYAYSRTTQRDAYRLAEYLIQSVKWIAMVKGNHDMWSGGSDPLDWIKGTPPVTTEWEAQIELVFPNGWNRRVWIRHDFQGSSVYNKNHALRKTHLFTGAAHIYAAGHKHNQALQYDEDGRGESLTIRARGYKTYDDHAIRLGHHPQSFGATQTVLLDPAKGTMIGCPYLEEAAEWLRWKRGRSA